MAQEHDEEPASFGGRAAAVLGATVVGLLVLGTAYFQFDQLSQGWVEEFRASRGKESCCLPVGLAKPVCVRLRQHLAWAGASLGETGSLANDLQRECRAGLEAPAPKIAAPAPTPSPAAASLTTATPAGTSLVPASGAAANGAPPPVRPVQANAEGFSAEACAGAVASSAPTLASLRDALAKPAAQRAETLRGWLCDAALRPRALAFYDQAGVALRGQVKSANASEAGDSGVADSGAPQEPGDAGATAAAGDGGAEETQDHLSAADGRRVLCELPWGSAIDADELRSAFSCPQCPNEDCAEDPSCGCGVPTEWPGRQNAADCMLAYCQDLYRTQEPPGLAACEKQSREVNGAWARLARQRAYLAEHPPGGPAGCIETVEDGSDVKVKLADGAWKAFEWSPYNNQSLIYSIKEVDCQFRQVLVGAEGGRAPLLLLDVKSGQVVGDLGYPPVWSPDHQFFVDGLPNTNDVNEDPLGWATVFHCGAQGCKEIWSTASLAFEGQRGGLQEDGDALWKGPSSLTLQLSPLESAPVRLSCECGPDSCACKDAKGALALRRGQGGPAPENIARAMTAARPEVLTCFQQARGSGVVLPPGTLHVVAFIHPGGRCYQSATEEVAVKGTPLSTCLERVVKSVDLGAFDLPGKSPNDGVTAQIEIEIPTDAKGH